MQPDPRVILDETGDLPRTISGDRPAGQVSEEPTPEPGDSEPHPDADTSPAPVMQDRRKPR